MASVTTSFKPTYSASGLISNLDTASMVTQLTALASAPIAQMQKQEAAIQAKISAEASLSSQLQQLQIMADSLAKTGIVASTAQTSSNAFAAQPTAGAAQGTYSIQVTQLAKPANDRTAAFDSAMSPVKGGTLHLSVAGKTADVTVPDGMQLADVAKLINGSGLRVSATVLATGTNAYLSVTTLDSGYAPTSDPSTALQITETSTGSTGQALGFSSITQAKNAKFTLDGLDFTRQSNTVTDAIQGVTLSLSATSTEADTLSVTTDAAASQSTLQNFVTAYNSMIASLRAQTSPAAGTDTSKLLTGNSAVGSLQSDLQQVTSATVNATGSIRSLADLGVTTDFTDGSISIDPTQFQKALAANPQGASSLFSQSTTGLGASIDALVKRYTNSVDGVFTQDAKGMNTNISNMDDSISRLQTSVSAYTQRLQSSFAMMETVLASMKTNQTYLTQAFNAIDNAQASK
jgi:flagellar hook-associated protein 2